MSRVVMVIEDLEPISTYLVYGHVASLDIFGDALVVPLQDTFEDIKLCLKANSIRLPVANDFVIAQQQIQD